MGEYKRLISYIYSYEKGIKAKNSGFAKIESRNGICKLNISLRISDILMNEAEDNSLEVFLFHRNNKRVEKIFLGRIRIISGCSEFKLQTASEKIGDKQVPLSEITGIFICSKAFLHKNSQLNIIYASEWDDIPIDVEAFTQIEENNGNNTNKVLQDNQKKDYNKESDSIDDRSGLMASEISEVSGEVSKKPTEFVDFREGHSESRKESTIEQDHLQEELREALRNERSEEFKEGRRTECDEELEESHRAECDEELEESHRAECDEELEESHRAECDEELEESHRAECGEEPEEAIEVNEIEEKPDCETCKRQLKEMLENEHRNEGKNKTLETEDYFRMLCNCYPKVKVEEIDGECIKITPHDISYLPRKYWNLCNNSFLLHGFYNYKYLLLCERKVNNSSRYMICVPGMFHNKEQAMARMFGFPEFEGRRQNGMMSFGYWCMYL